MDWCRGQGLNLRHTVVYSTEKEHLHHELENFRLYAISKLNLTKVSVSQYICKVRQFLELKSTFTDEDVQQYIQLKKETCTPDYVSNIISAFKAYFRNYKGYQFMNEYKHPPTPLRMKQEIEPLDVERFILAIDNLTVRTTALLLATSGLRKNEVLTLGVNDIDRNLGCIIPNCHTGQTKHSAMSFYNFEAEQSLYEYEEKNKCQAKLFVIGHETFLKEWNNARAKTGLHLKPKDLRDFFSQEMGKALIPDRYIDIFQGRAPRSVLSKHYTPQGKKLLREIYDKAKLTIYH